MRFPWLATALAAFGCAPANAPIAPPAPPAPIAPQAAPSAIESASAPEIEPAPSPSGSAATAEPEPSATGARTLTLLYTSDEHGWLTPHGHHGGAVALFSQWIKSEHLCVASEGHGCEQAANFAFSGGDNWTGPAVSGFFKGQPMAEAMRTIGYVGSAIGNHEFDFGQTNIADNVKRQGFDFLAANVHWADGHAPLPVRPMIMVQRAGVHIAIVGVATTSTPIHSLPTNVEGITFEDEETALAREVPKAWEAGADAVVVAGHVCPDMMAGIVRKHPDWKLAFASAGHCHQIKSLVAGHTPVIEPGADLTHYARITLNFDMSRPPRDRFLHAAGKLVEIGAEPEAADTPQPVAKLREQLAPWFKKTDETLGEVIGYTTRGMRRESAPMVKWLLGTWRKQTHSQVAIMNRSGMRQDLSPGPVHVRELYDILPFNNRLVTLKLRGQDLLHEATCCKGFVDGMKRTRYGWMMSDGRRLDPEAQYDVVVPDYAYYGGSGFTFKEHVPDAQIGDDWRTPITAWMRENKTTRAKPLESVVLH